MNVHEIFCSIQGEGRYAGTPAFFIRLQGCPVGCAFCDTKKSWSEDPDKAKFLHLSPQAVADSVAEMQKANPRIRLVVITGGEPFYGENGEELLQLVECLQIGCGLRISIETSGTCAPDAGFEHLKYGRVHVTISPKYKQPDAFLPVYPELLAFYSPTMGLCPVDLKFLVDGTPQAESRIDKFVKEQMRYELLPTEAIGLYLQPVDFGGADTRTYYARQSAAKEQAVELAKKYGWNVSCQLHKYLAIL